MKKAIENIEGILLPLLNAKSKLQQVFIISNRSLPPTAYSFNQTKFMRRFILFAGFLLPFIASAQLRGRVINENNKGIPFASVTVKNTQVGTTTDSTGQFTISNEQKFPFVLVV